MQLDPVLLYLKMGSTVVEDKVPAPDVHNQDQDDVGGDRDQGGQNITEGREEFVKFSDLKLNFFSRDVPKVILFQQ